MKAPIALKERHLTAAEFQGLAAVPPELEWFANIRNDQNGLCVHSLRATAATNALQPGRIPRKPNHNACLHAIMEVTRQALSELVNERIGISVVMAIRLSKAFGSTPEMWLGMQMAYDLWQARDRAGQIAVERFAAA